MGRLEILFQQMKLKKLEGLAKAKKDVLMKFHKKIPVIRALTTKGLEPGHITKMAKKLGQPEKTDVTKSTLDALGTPEQHIAYLEGEADFALRQYTMFNNLQDMKK